MLRIEAVLNTVEYKKMQTSNTHTHTCVCRHIIQPIPLLSYLSIFYTLLKQHDPEHYGYYPFDRLPILILHLLGHF